MGAEASAGIASVAECLLPAVVHIRSFIEPLADFEENQDRFKGAVELEGTCTGDAFLRAH